MTLTASAVGPQGYTRKYEATDLSVRMARRDVGMILSTWHLDVLADDAKQVASELVTNVVEHAVPECENETIEMRLLRLEFGVRVTIIDHCPKPPVLKEEAAPTDVNGRGLFLVSLLASDWGWTPQETGKQVWAELRV